MAKKIELTKVPKIKPGKNCETCPLWGGGGHSGCFARLAHDAVEKFNAAGRAVSDSVAKKLELDKKPSQVRTVQIGVDKCPGAVTLPSDFMPGAPIILDVIRSAPVYLCPGQEAYLVEDKTGDMVKDTSRIVVSDDQEMLELRPPRNNTHWRVVTPTYSSDAGRTISPQFYEMGISDDPDNSWRANNYGYDARNPFHTKERNKRTAAALKIIEVLGDPNGIFRQFGEYDRSSSGHPPTMLDNIRDYREAFGSPTNH
ncbi:MAG: hypothetical protein LBM73_03440 [Candidatus Nomurabacteria bacterium]|nr:hypothetical protein [Candidatus Nomurabacteria bacterium]